MKIIITDTPALSDKEFVIDQLWAHNSTFDPVEIKPLFLSLRDENNQIEGGLIASTWWKGLEIQYLWISQQQRGKGQGRELMQQAERVARERGCQMAYVDTFSFQAREFYEKLGYQVYGSMEGYADKHTRFYLKKTFPKME